MSVWKNFWVRWQIFGVVLGVSILIAIAVWPDSGGRRVSLDSLQGQQVDVLLGKSMWVACLPTPEVKNVTLSAVMSDRVCFTDSTGGAASTLGRCPEEFVVGKDGAYCVFNRYLSRLDQDGKPVWGSGTAYPEKHGAR
jgi:hypothetical protein